VDRGQNVMRAARERAGLDKALNMYSFRHTCAKWLRSQSVDAWRVAAQLGHRREGFEITEIYAAFDPEYLKDAGEALNVSCQL
jgi:integrase